jgi:ABC-type transport system substrate-binding protein
MMRSIGYKMIFLWLCICLGAGCKGARIREHEYRPGQPVRGGTLEVVGRSDVDHLASTSSYVSLTWGLLRAFTRTLVAYPASGDFGTAVRLAADMAMQIPSRENGGLSADGLTYIFHLRRGVRWDTVPPREVTAHDFVRAFKLFCNPVSPVGAPGYYTSTITGMERYCTRFARVPGNVESIREFVETKELDGVRAVDDSTVVFRLLHPTPDFLNLVAMPFASPVPAEYVNYLPDSPEFRIHTLSCGPYRITRYIQNQLMILERNPFWNPATDPIRHAYVDRIHVHFGMDAQLQQLQITAGTADLSYDEQIPTAELASLMTAKDPTLWLSPPGSSFMGFTFLLLNHVGPPGNSLTRHLQIRRAIAIAVDKAALVKLAGGPAVSRALRQAVPSAVSGYRREADQYATPGDRGNSEFARTLLAAEGYPQGISLRLFYPSTATFPLQAQALQASLSRAGITVELEPKTTGDFWGRILPNPENALRGEWDLALSGWIPDWFGGNNGRSVIEPLFDGRYFGKNTQNYGGYSNPEVDALIDRATTAGSPGLAEQAWSEAARRLMEDVALVPLVENKMRFAQSRRLRNCAWSVLGPNCDISSVWLSDAAQEKRSSR